MEELGPGIYETLITEGLLARLDALGDRLLPEPHALRSAEAADRIAWHLSRQIEAALNDVGDSDRVAVGLQVAQALLQRVGHELLLVEFGSCGRPTDSQGGLTYLADLHHHGRDNVSGRHS